MSFDPLAPHYRWMEWLLAGGKLQRCRTAFLERVSEARDVLVMGEGNGRFLVACRTQLSRARITCVDASAGMLAQARRRLRLHGLGEDRVHFLQADALSWTPPARSFDLVATHFFLDCFRPEQLSGLIAGLARAVRPQATWLLADFCTPEAGLVRQRARWIQWSMYRFFRCVARLPATRLTEPDGYLRAEGFELRQRRFSEWGLLHTDLWQSSIADDRR